MVPDGSKYLFPSDAWRLLTRWRWLLASDACAPLGDSSIADTAKAGAGCEASELPLPGGRGSG